MSRKIDQDYIEILNQIYTKHFLELSESLASACAAGARKAGGKGVWITALPSQRIKKFKKSGCGLRHVRIFFGLFSGAGFLVGEGIALPEDSCDVALDGGGGGGEREAFLWPTTVVGS